MKAEIKANGSIKFTIETELESFAMQRWFEDFDADKIYANFSLSDPFLDIEGGDLGDPEIKELPQTIHKVLNVPETFNFNDSVCCKNYTSEEWQYGVFHSYSDAGFFVLVDGETTSKEFKICNSFDIPF